MLPATSAMKNILYFLFTILSIQAFGCKCAFPILIENYQRSDFVAVVKILKVTPDPQDEAYHTLEIEPIHLYKGKEYSIMKVNTFANTSCAFSLPEGSTWLVFAKLGNEGVPGFGACSGSQQIHRAVDAVKHSTAAEKGIDLKLEVLSFLKKNELEDSNPYNLNLFDTGIPNTTIFRGFDNHNRFAVYELDINKDLSIDKITALREFDNPKLAQLLSEYLRKNARVNNTYRKGIPTKTKLVAVFYYYTTEGKAASFLSIIDL